MEEEKGNWRSDPGLAFKNKVNLFSNYKYVLAFENNNVTDYVTEKLPLAYLGKALFIFQNLFVGGALPVYMGAPNVEDWEIGPNSLIRTDNFSSPLVTIIIRLIILFLGFIKLYKISK